MNDNQGRQNLNDDEFDIELLYEKLGRISRRIWTRVTYPVRLLFARPVLLVACIACGVALAFVLKKTLTPVYRSTFVIQPINRTDLFYLNLLYDLNVMLQEENYAVMSQHLALDQEICKKVSSLKVDVFYQNNGRKDTVVGTGITLNLTDPAVVDTVQNSIMRYFSANPHYKKVQMVRTVENESLERKLEEDIRQNDSLKRILTNNAIPRAGAGGFVYGEPIDPVKVYEAGMSLAQRLISIRSQKQYLDNFELAKPAFVSNKPYFPKLSLLLLVSVGFSVLVCLVINFFLAKRS